MAGITDCQIPQIKSGNLMARPGDGFLTVRRPLISGVLDRADAGQVIFPYAAVHVNFTVTTAA
jgi:hypothetical protein